MKLETMSWSAAGQAVAAAAALIAAVWGAIKIYRDSEQVAGTSALDGFNRLVERLETRLAGVEGELSHARTRIAALEVQSETDQRQIRELRTQSETDQRQIRELLSYIAYLQRFIGERLPGQVPLSLEQRRDREAGT